MDELVDILDEEGNRTGETMLKSMAHRKGLFHPTVHVWLYTANGLLLLQKRAAVKETHPLLWDVSVAGHIAAGEEIITAALREVKEEIGLELQASDLEKIGVFRSVHRHTDTLVDSEYHHTFISELKVPVSGLLKQESEVDDLALVPLLRFSEEVWGLALPSKYVPHGTNYYASVISAIQKKL